MEILEIRSPYDLTVRKPDARKLEKHSYQVNCRQFSNLLRQWQNNLDEKSNPLGVMTLGLEQIWVTPEEGAQIAAAIKSTSASVELKAEPPQEQPAPPA